jgi:signal transduction histidine kinase/PAS domain-containing protein
MEQNDGGATRNRQSMNETWTTLPHAPDVLRHADDARPAWLWSADGQKLIWSNPAAALFLARIKKHGLKRAQPARPIKGQVARIIRLGSPGRSSLARIQFIAGEQPVSATCTTTPLIWDKDEIALLIVGVDPIHADILALAGETTPAPVVSESSENPSPQEPVEDAAQPDHDDAYQHELQSWQDADAEAVYETAATEPSHIAQQDEPQAWEEALDDNPVVDPGEQAESAEAEPKIGRLSALVEKLAADDALYAPLTEADDHKPDIAEPVEQDHAQDDIEDEVDGREFARLYRVTGRGFTPSQPEPDVEDETDDDIPLDADMPENEPAAAVEDQSAPDMETPPDPEAVERVSRYNFDELSRILGDRIGERSPQKTEIAAPAPVSPASGALINLGGETLVLNRLPLGILVFRDQQILFANRAITEMVGYDSADGLRQAGLAAVFPKMGDEGHDAGPVNHLVQRNGTLVPVTARLQSISWQGRPALMLSASTTEVRTGHEDAVRAFASNFADLRGDGFVEATRSGTISSASAMAVSLLSGGKPMTGKALSALIGEDDRLALQAFLERPARFAETARPSLPLRSADGRSDILLFALGQAGIVSGYFGFVHAREMAPPARIGGNGEADPALLGRISRGVRRPLNTIMGFSEIIGSKAFGALGNERYEGYAEDISRAGREIAALVDELDDYARLRDGRYLPQRASLDLTDLLENCVLRIRDQANAGRVIVRNAISEALPRVTADRASLAQAVLNLLASAIDQTPTGGTVIISAQRLDDDAIAIHVRDSSAHAVDMAERFVVFRDGVDRDGQTLTPIRSSVGLALTRSLLAVNAVSLSVDPAGNEGLLFSLKIPADLVDFRNASDA